MVTGELLMTRNFEGDAGIDLLDSIDEVTKKVSFALLGREIALGNIAVNIREENKAYNVYINGQLQGTATSTEVYEDTLIADTDVEVSLRLIETNKVGEMEEKEVYRETVNVAESDTFNIEYSASGMILIKAVDLPNAKIYLNNELDGVADENGDYTIVNIPAGVSQKIRVEYDDKEVDSATESVEEGETLVLVMGSGGKKLLLGAKLLDGGGPSLMGFVGFNFTPKLYMTVGGGVMYINYGNTIDTTAFVPMADVSLGYNLINIDAIGLKLGASLGGFFHFVDGSTVFSLAARAEAEWMFLFTQIGFRYSFQPIPENIVEQWDALTWDEKLGQKFKPILTVGVKFNF